MLLEASCAATSCAATSCAATSCAATSCTTSEPQRPSLPLGGVPRVSTTRNCAGYVTEFAPHKALKLIVSSKLTFDETVVRHRVPYEVSPNDGRDSHEDHALPLDLSQLFDYFSQLQAMPLVNYMHFFRSGAIDQSTLWLDVIPDAPDPDLSHRKCLYGRLAKVDFHKNPSTYSFYK